MEKLLLEAITHIKSIIKKKPKMERLLTYINKYSATNCHEATIQDTLFILHTKNLIDENLKLLCENNKLVDDEISSLLFLDHLIRLLKIQIKFLILF